MTSITRRLGALALAGIMAGSMSACKPTTSTGSSHAKKSSHAKQGMTKAQKKRLAKKLAKLAAGSAAGGALGSKLKNSGGTNVTTQLPDGTPDISGGVSAAQAKADLAKLVVATPSDHDEKYVRSTYRTWLSATKYGWGDRYSGCNARNAALVRDGVNVKTTTGCKISSGSWRSPYTTPATLAKHKLGGVLTEHKMDIDHIVPLGEVHISGGSTWDKDRRAEYANDPQVLVTADLWANRQKSDQTPATWLPEINQCGYVVRYVTVKAKYGLTVTQAEKSKMEQVLAQCK